MRIFKYFFIFFIIFFNIQNILKLAEILPFTIDLNFIYKYIFCLTF